MRSYCYFLTFLIPFVLINCSTEPTTEEVSVSGTESSAEGENSEGEANGNDTDSTTGGSATGSTTGSTKSGGTGSTTSDDMDDGEFCLPKDGGCPDDTGSSTGSSSDDPNAPPPTIPGQFLSVKADGFIQGWAADLNNFDEQVNVRVFIDGTSTTGTLAATITADGFGFDGNAPGAHSFALTSGLPSQFYTRTPREVRVYAEINNSLVLLEGSPKTMAFYTFSQAGRTSFDSDVKSELQKCVGCHTDPNWTSYESRFKQLLNPSPFEGGSRTNNTLFNKAMGRGHSGGDQCGGSDENSPCKQIKEWYDDEF